MGTDIDYVNFFTRFDYKEVMEELGRTPYCRYICFEIFSMEKSSRFAAHMADLFYHNMQHSTRYIKNQIFKRFCIKLVEIINFALLVPFAP